jgi:hypothetical protein
MHRARWWKQGELFALILVVTVVMIAAGCETTTHERTTEYTPGGEVSSQRYERSGEIRRELRRVFENTVIDGVGVFENSNEGLARKAAISLAVDDLAAKVQTEVRSNTVIYQNEDVRSTVETNVHALVNNYRIDFEGYDPGTNKYRVRISVRGEQLIREIERWIE